MRILLIGEYSNVHATLSLGLKELGHDVTVISNGDFWKNYPRDIDVSRKKGKLGGLALISKILCLLPKMRNYDIVQVINPMFFELKAERLFAIYNYLRKHNKKIILGAFGMDWYWVYTNTFIRPLRYSDFNIGNNIRKDYDAIKEQNDWLYTSKERLNRLIANDCDHIITGLYEYDICYRKFFNQKTTFIPFPIKVENKSVDITKKDKVHIFCGISKNRNTYKGTDIMLKAASDLAKKHSDLIEVDVVEGLPFFLYQQRMENADLILDQLYSYTPAMNALLAMSKGIVCVGGGEPENYQILKENELRPILNVYPTYESVYNELAELVLSTDKLTRMKQESIKYVQKHHNYLKVAQRYEELYANLLKT